MSNSHATNPSGPAVGSAKVDRLLASNPVAAEARAREALKSQPQSTDALSMLGAALRQQGRAAEAVAILGIVVAAEPDSAFAQFELGLTLGLLGLHQAAFDALGRAVDLSPTSVAGWCAIADALAQAERSERWSAEAHRILELTLVAIRGGRFSEAETLLGDLLERHPDCQPARLGYAIALLAQEKGHLALQVIAELVRRDPGNAWYRELRASALHETGEFHEAIAQYQELLNDGRQRPGAWLSYGRALRAIGREEASLEAFRKSVEILPGFAAGYRTLAAVKTVSMPPEAVDVLRALLARPGQLVSRRAQLHFALAKALEDAGCYGESFENYRRSNELRGAGVSKTVDQFLDLVQRTKALFTPAFLRAQAGSGCDTAAPIFVVGMPRAGSTLVQEILAAHSGIESTGERRDLSNMAMRLRMDREGEPGGIRYPEVVGLFDAGRLRAFGEEYLERTRPHRKRGSSFFIDKLPENFMHVGLIQLALPNARIIDVRRHPLDCSFSCFTNYFPEGPKWTHRLDDLGRYYAGYVELMAHFDEVMPGRVHRIFYERLVEEPEKEVRRLLEYIGLAFELACLRFHEREQAIVTVSAEQARRSIYRSGVGSSRNFEPWLAPLKSALGHVLDTYPDIPKFYPSLRASYTLRLA